MILSNTLIYIILLVTFYMHRSRTKSVDRTRAYSRMIIFTWSIIVLNLIRYMSVDYLSDGTNVILSIVALLLGIIILIDLIRSSI